MSRTIGGALASHLATRSHTRCDMLRLDLRDGTSIGITDHDLDLTFNLGDGTITYEAGTGITLGDLSLSTGLEADNFEASGPIGDTVTLAGLLGGRFDGARARRFQVNWKSLGSGAIKLMAGNVREVRVEGGRFVFEIRSDADRFNQTIGRLITPYCPGDHATCCVQIADELATTVSAVPDEYHLTVAAAITPADYADGRLWFTSGALAGTDPIEIVGGSGSTLELFEPLPATPSNGDGVTIKEGCNRTREMCRDRFDNAINFRGFPEVPGSDQALKVPVPGT